MDVTATLKAAIDKINERVSKPGSLSPQEPHALRKQHTRRFEMASLKRKVNL